MLTRGTIYAVRATNFNRDYAARAYVCVNYADGTTLTATAGVIGSAITEIQTQSVVDNVVTISVLSVSEQEPLIIVNGMPIRGALILVGVALLLKKKED